MMKSNLHTGESKAKRLHPVKLEFSLFSKSQCMAYSPAWWILYHVNVSCKGPIKSKVKREGTCSVASFSSIDFFLAQKK